MTTYQTILTTYGLNTVRVEYRNETGSSITVAAHDLWCEVTR